MATSNDLVAEQERTKPDPRSQSYSPFLNPALTATDGDLVLIALSRQTTVPAILRKPTPSDPTDQITNTRFGSYPHSTLLGKPWGSQILASNVNARDRNRGKKRKRSESDNPTEVAEDDGDTHGEVPAFEAAASGFAHLLYPTPETWTYSLPHRTQVVYPPDYSYIIQRIQARPGDTVIEAGAGSGSFTHAAARAVFNGFPDSQEEPKRRRLGHVYSFEYHEPRFQTLRHEIKAHGLSSTVTLTERDVYKDGFTLDRPPSLSTDQPSPLPIQADAIFLDLPAPWLALSHLTRQSPSPLNPFNTVHLCTFSPCIEQAMKTIETMREQGWLEIDMVEVCHRRIDVRRDRIGLHEEGLRGVNASPATVDEALGRLRELEQKQSDYHQRQKEAAAVAAGGEANGAGDKKGSKSSGGAVGRGGRRERLENIKSAATSRKMYKEGTLMHRSEPELKTHTSYLVFALLPREWTAEDEERCLREWPV